MSRTWRFEPEEEDDVPFKSAKQRRFIYHKAGKGVKWAKKFIRDSGHAAPKTRKRHK